MSLKIHSLLCRLKSNHDINRGVCPMEEDSGMLMSSVVIKVHMCGWEGEKRGAMGLSKRTKNGAVGFEQGASKGKSLQLCTKCHHSK
jgi:hypothetical protein